MRYVTYIKYGELVVRIDRTVARETPDTSCGRYTIASEPPNHPSRGLLASSSLDMSVVGYIPAELVDAIDAAADGTAIYVDTTTNTVVGGGAALDADTPAPRRIRDIYQRVLDRLAQPEVGERKDDV